MGHSGSIAVGLRRHPLEDPSEPFEAATFAANVGKVLEVIALT